MSSVMIFDTLSGDHDLQLIERYWDASIVTNGPNRTFSNGHWFHPYIKTEKLKRSSNRCQAQHKRSSNRCQVHLWTQLKSALNAAQISSWTQPRSAAERSFNRCQTQLQLTSSAALYCCQTHLQNIEERSSISLQNAPPDTAFKYRI